MKRSVVILGLAVMLAGCGHNGSETDNMPTTLSDALNDHVFELKEVDGKPFTVREVGAPSLSFIHDTDASLRINGQMCNNFMGKATLQEQVLKAPMLAMTRRLCADDQLNDLDHALGKMLENGATVDYAHGKLTLKGSDRTLVYYLKVGGTAEQKSAAGSHH